MFEPHDDRREQPVRSSSRIAAFAGFVVGFAIGWAVWFLLIRPALTGDPTPENPSGEAAAWLYYGSLLGCLVLALFIVAVIGEWIGSRRAKAS